MKTGLIKILGSWTICLCLTVSVQAQSNLVPDDAEFQALKVLYDSLGGANWTVKTNWPTQGNWPATATAAQFGTWYGVTVVNGDVQSFTIASNNAVGKIPSAIGNLTELRTLQVRLNNGITGKIPNSMANLTKLITFMGYTNNFTGTIPSFFNNLTSLTTLQIGSPSLTGPIPDFSNLTQMRHLMINGSNLTQGPVPSWLANMPLLITLDMASSRRNGSLPSLLGGLTALTNLNFYNNQLTGSIPPQIANLSNLQYLTLSNNQLTGAIPSFPNFSSLIQLSLNNNQLSGSIPAQLGNASTTTVVDLSANQLSGPIPSSIGSLTKLITLRLQTNLLTGSIPSELSQLINVAAINLNSNKLSGELPSSLGNLSKLQFFYASGNSITGNLPASYANLTKMVQFYMEGTKMSGVIPDNFFTTWTSLTNFSVSGNNFSGPFPSSIDKCTLLGYLRADFCKFTSLPSTMLSVKGAVNFEGNELTSVPNFDNHVNKAALNLRLVNNRLDYSQLELFVNKGIGVLAYAPQKSIIDVTTATLVAGSDFTLTARPRGTFTSKIKWEKQNPNGSWTDITLSNAADQEGVVYRIASAQVTSEGTYRWSCTSTVANTFTLMSEPIVVKTKDGFVLDNLSFQYKYDHRKRMIGKKVPGADWVYMVYDDRDRLVMSQDGEQRKSNKWSFNKYDAFNRVIMTGIYTHHTFLDRDQMAALISTTSFFETYSGLTSDVPTYGYTDIVFPRLNNPSFPNAKLDILTVTYFDNYDFVPLRLAYRQGLLNGQYQHETGGPFPRVMGQITGVINRVLGSNQLLTSVNYYDDKYRLIQIVSDNYRGGVDCTTNKLDFVGKIIESKTSQEEFSIALGNLTGIIWDGKKAVRDSNGSFFGGASSMAGLAPGADGWVQFVTTFETTNRALGFSNVDIDGHYATIDFAWVLTSSSDLQIYEGGVFKVTIPGKIQNGELLSIERSGGKIIYRRNGAIARISPVISTTSLIVDLSIYHNGGQIQDIRASFGKNTPNTVTRRFEYDHVGRLLKTWHSTDNFMQWKDKQGVMPTAGKGLVKISASNTWDAGATSEKVLSAGTNGWVEAKVGLFATTRAAFGLSDQNVDHNYTTIDYGFLVMGSASPTVEIRENGAVRGSYPVLAGDILRVERSGSSITYKKNGVQVYVSTIPYGGSLVADVAFGTASSEFTSITSSFETAIEILLAKNEYNELGQLVDKKLHSVDNENTFRQSIDYRYNIRGWLTSINNSSLTGDNGATNDEANDLFGMNLWYNKFESGIDNSPLFNGNISAIQWSNNLGLGDLKERAYTYSYDPMNRLNHATPKEKTAGWVASQSYAEAGLSYDLNGNIRTLTRKGEGGSLMDVLGYDYGSGNMLSNKLLKVTDTGDKGKGFIDGTNVDDDYAYDANGNMTIDRNKAIHTSTGTAGITYNHLNLPERVTKSNGDYIKYVYDAGGKKLSQQVYNVSNVLKKRSDYAGEFFYENDTLKFINHEEGRIVMTGTSPEYQYHMKDHLGNVRMTFTTKDEIENPRATMETANATEEQSKFLYYSEAIKIRHPLFDHTNNYVCCNGDPDLTDTNGYAIRLSGTAAERTGLARSVSVMPGDKIDIEVFAKFIDPNPANLTPELLTFLASLAPGGGAPAGTIVDGGLPGSIGNSVFPFAGLMVRQNDNGTGPRAYLNYLVFDRNFNMKNIGYRRLSAGASETGFDTPHERLAFEGVDQIKIIEPGYVYIWLSNESESQVDVYFDDFKVTQTKSPVIQTEEYYPFGLAFNSYSRENSTPNQFLFNGKEKQDELDLGWYDYGARMYEAETGRWKVQDGKAEYYFATSPYVYALNQPTNAIDPDGNIVIFINGNHFGTSAPGASYWQTTQSVSTYKSYSFFGQHLWSGMERHDVPRSFDGEVMDQLGDHKARYYDGSGGGWHPFGYDRRLSASAGGRMLLGFADGARDAKDIIANLARDKSGNIVETIKIVTHSMGGAYGKGFVQALKAYIKTLPIEQQKQILISLVADFDPFQAADLTADPDIKTMQFIHKNGWNVTGMGGLANEEEQGDKETHTNTGSSTDHSIFSFFNDISKLEEGTYTWDGSKWVKQ